MPPTREEEKQDNIPKQQEDTTEESESENKTEPSPQKKSSKEKTNSLCYAHLYTYELFALLLDLYVSIFNSKKDDIWCNV